MTDSSLVLPDGRRLAYASAGGPADPAVFYFHGWPGSRLEAGFAELRGLRVIALDRPGYGGSSPQRRRRLLDWPRDVCALADALELERFAVMGVSGGAPYAAACAFALPERVRAAALVCGLGPPEAPAMRAGGAGALVRFGRRGLRAAFLLGLGRRLLFSERAERRLDRYGPLARHLLTSWREGLRGGVRGAASDARIYGEPWGFRLEDLRVPVYLWHGGRDRSVPVAIGRWCAERIPGCVARFPAEADHHSVVLRYLDEIAQDLRRAFT